jgi:hypothetical protein
MPEAEDEPAEPDQPTADPVAASNIASADAGATGGAAEPWDRLTPTHIERAKHQLGIRRATILARQAEELTALVADRTEINALAQAIDAFAQKFNLTAATRSAMQLDDQRNRLEAD